MATMKLKRAGSVFILTLTNGNCKHDHNRRRRRIQRRPRRVGGRKGQCRLVLTSSDIKFWCNGINLRWLLAQPPDCFPKLAAMLDRMFLRLALLKHADRRLSHRPYLCGRR